MNSALVRRLFTASALAFACLALGACKSGPPKCAKPGVYAEAQSIPPLRIPAGLQAADTRGALRIPDLDEQEQALPPGVSCLEQPPRYAPNAQLTKPEDGKKPRKRDRKAASAAAPAAPAPPPVPSP